MKYVTLTCLVLLITACSSADIVQDIKPSGDVQFSTIETTFPVVKRPGNDFKINIRALKTSKKSKQNLAADKELEIGNQTIFGPTEISLDTDITFISVGMGIEPKLFSVEYDKWSSKLYFGISQTDINLALQHEGDYYDVDQTNLELFYLFGLTYKVSPSFGIEASYQFGSGGIVCCTYSNTELRLRYLLLEHLEILAGYRWFNYMYFKPNTDTDIEIDFRGPLAGIHILF